MRWVAAKAAFQKRRNLGPLKAVPFKHKLFQGMTFFRSPEASRFRRTTVNESFLRSITTTARMATVAPATRQRPIYGPRVQWRGREMRALEPEVPRSRPCPTPKSKGCREIEMLRVQQVG